VLRPHASVSGITRSDKGRPELKTEQDRSGGLLGLRSHSLRQPSPDVSDQRATSPRSRRQPTTRRRGLKTTLTMIRQVDVDVWKLVTCGRDKGFEEQAEALSRTYRTGSSETGGPGRKNELRRGRTEKQPNRRTRCRHSRYPEPKPLPFTKRGANQSPTPALGSDDYRRDHFQRRAFLRRCLSSVGRIKPCHIVPTVLKEICHDR
jgi:hypothetical protein